MTLEFLFTCQPKERSNKLSPIPETIEEDHECSQTSEDEEKPPSITEQALELKQAMRELAEICGDHTAAVQTQNIVKRLEKERCVAHNLHVFWFKLDLFGNYLEQSGSFSKSLICQWTAQSSSIGALRTQVRLSVVEIQFALRARLSSSTCGRVILIRHWFPFQKYPPFDL